jgi:hypothetical protein
MLIKREPVIAKGLRFREDMPYAGDFFFGIQLAEEGRTIFLDAESHLFNTGSKTRFYFAGVDAHSVMEEHRVCTHEIARLLRGHGRDGARAFKGLWNVYLWLFYEHQPFGVGESRRMFAGSVLHQSLAQGNSVLHKLNSVAPFLVPAARRLRKLGTASREG